MTRPARFQAQAVVVALWLGTGVATPQPGELIIRNGTIVTDAGTVQGDLRIRNGLISEIGENGERLTAGSSAREISADGLLVLPGGIEPHVHLGGNWVDDYTSGSAAALAGGITTISNFVAVRGDQVAEAMAQAAAQVHAEAIADVILHPIIGEPVPVTPQLEALAASGHTSLKLFMVRPSFDLNVPGFLNLLAAAGDTGVLTMLHCEDAAIVSATAERFITEGRGALRYYPDARPVLAEVVATQRAVAFSETTGAPIYLVHLSSERALRVAEEAQARGLPVYVETRPIYLHLTRERFEGPDAGLYMGQPPLRTQQDQDALWDGIARGSIHTIGTDHVAYTREQKLDPEQDVQRHRAGMNNLQVMRPMLYSDGVLTGRITVERFVTLTATNPAKLFGLYPAKGMVAVGADADLVIWDPDETRTIRDEDALSNIGFSIHAGREVTGWPIVTIRRGEVVYENGRVTGAAGCRAPVPSRDQGPIYLGAPPNILVIVVDDLRWDDIGVAGHPFIQTPAIDRLAHEGALFENAFATTPLGSPGRASVLTGLYPHAHGITDNTDHSVESHQLPTFARDLQRAGYTTGFVGTWQMGNDETRRTGFDYWATLRGQGEAIDPFLNDGVSTTRVEGYVTDVLTDHAVAFLEQPHDGPFMLFLAHTALHPTVRQLDNGGTAAPESDPPAAFIPAERHRGIYTDATVPRRPSSGVPPRGKPALERQIDDLPPLGPDTITTDRTIRDRLEMLLAVDDGVARLTDTLRQAGELDNTIIIFTSDHGYFYGEHGLNAERRLAYEETLRIPLIVRFPPLVRPGSRVGPLSLSIDLAPTLLDLADIEPDHPLHGRSLLPVLVGRPSGWRTAFLAEYYSDTVFRRIRNMGYQAVRTDRYKYIHYTDLDGMDELYDLVVDPFEMENLIVDPAHAETLALMQSELERLLEETR